MNKEKILKEFAPCGIDCSRCVSHESGYIKKLSIELSDALGNFETLAQKIAAFNPVLAGYPKFKEVLEFLANGECKGCRNGGGQYPSCAAKDCFREKKVDFCFECGEYPCSKNKYDPSLSKKWKDNNDYMKEHGIEEFYIKQKKSPRY